MKANAKVLVVKRSLLRVNAQSVGRRRDLVEKSKLGQISIHNQKMIVGNFLVPKLRLGQTEHVNASLEEDFECLVVVPNHAYPNPVGIETMAVKFLLIGPPILLPNQGYGLSFVYVLR